MNAEENSFRKLQEEDELNFPVPPEIEENIFGTLQMLTIMGHAMEMFIPKAIDMFILTLGGTIREIDGLVKEEDSAAGDPSVDFDEDTPGIGGSPPQA